MKQKQSTAKKLILFVILVAIFWFGIYFSKSDAYWVLVDSFRNYNYHPNQAISELAEQISLKDNSLRIFYASRPEILGRSDFSEHCKNQLEETSVLGCYKDGKIYVFDVENEELSGVEQVTAAHEFLHAVWSRFSAEEKSRLGELLRRDYERLKTPEFEQIMKNYAITQPGEHENELHSILGTEFSSLSPELEKHYAKYFKNRQEIVGYYQKYSRKFKELDEKIARFKADIETRTKQIETDREFYSQNVNEYERAVENFNSRAGNGDFSSQSEFYAQRNILVHRRENLETQRTKLTQDISKLNEDINELNALVVRSNSLHKSVDSKV